MLLLQANGIRTDAGSTYFGYPMRDLPGSYVRDDKYPLPQMVKAIKNLSLDRNRKDVYPWTVFADSHLTNEKIVDKLERGISSILKADNGIKKALALQCKELQEYEEIQGRLSIWKSFRPSLEMSRPSPFKDRNIDKLDMQQLQGYNRNITENILYELREEIVGSPLEYGNILNNACCLSQVQLDYEKPITNYFAYFTEVIGKNKKLLKYFQKAYEVDRAIRMVRSRYTKMRYDKPRDLREKLMNYLSMNLKKVLK